MINALVTQAVLWEYEHMTNPSKPHITGSLFYYWVRCPYWAFTELHQSGGERKELSDLARRLMEEGVKYEQEYIEKGLGVSEKDMKTVEIIDLDEAAVQTIEWMTEGVEWIYQGVLMDGHYVGRPDLLRKKKMPRGQTSRFGKYYYEPVDIKSGRSLRSSYKLQVAFYAFILEKLQEFSPPEGGIINIDQDYVSFSISEFDNQFQLTLGKIEDMVDGTIPPPFVGAACKENPWEKSCISSAESCDHVSLIYRIQKTTVERLVSEGIDTIDKLARQTPHAVTTLMKGKMKDEVARRLITQAKSLSQKEVVILEKPELPVSDREIFFDIEGDPFEGVEYLFGFLDVKDGKEEYISFVAESPEEEKKMWKEMLTWAKTIEKGTPIYHFADYERSHMIRMADEYGMPKSLEPIIFGGLVDVLPYVRSSVVMPLYFYSLKDVARYLGFQWSHEKAGGAQSILWYQQWMDSGDREILDTIIQYNKEDVIATKVIKEWLVGLEVAN